LRAIGSADCELNSECLTDRITQAASDLSSAAPASSLFEELSRPNKEPSKSGNPNFPLCLEI
jgi:hypothetical protein